MVHFSIHQITASFSPKNLRLRKRKSSNASTTVSEIASSPSNLSIASSTIYRRRNSIESITSTSTAASSAFLDACDDLGLTSPYYLPAKCLSPPTKRKQLPTPQRKLTATSISSTISTSGLMIDLCGFHHVDAAEESFSPELAVLEPRPDALRFCGFEETLEQRSMLPFRL
ncbi:hypothetical protein TWF730_008188 [Orbilia blumenaviensis]|uniref:Uncharacterized protein n=1 Tax=Orbilia blumenaviensis TaxID=1796055 RepID=A0AAV9V8A7_9PEZI